MSAQPPEGAHPLSQTHVRVGHIWRRRPDPAPEGETAAPHDPTLDRIPPADAREILRRLDLDIQEALAVIANPKTPGSERHFAAGMVRQATTTINLIRRSPSMLAVDFAEQPKQETEPHATEDHR